MALVILPCDLPWWSTLQTYLQQLENVNEIDDLIKGMLTIYTMCNVGLDPDEPDIPDQSVFDGLKWYLSCDSTHEERDHFFKITLPIIVKNALNLKAVKPTNGLQFSLQQQVSQLDLPRDFIRSLIAHAFFSTFPKRTHKTHPTLQDFNFSYFFEHLNQKFQKAKLRSLFYYFDISDIGNLPKGTVKIIRQVMSSIEWLTIEDWLECCLPLCPLMIKHECRMENADPNKLFVCFSNKKIGGKTLSDGSSKECIQFLTCPELLVILLCVEALEDNEVITVEGCLEIGKINNPRKKGIFEPAPADKIHSINVCCMDAESYIRLPLSQYEEDNILRELNKALLGFRQKQQQLLHHTYHQPLTRRLSPIGESTSCTPTENNPNKSLNSISEMKKSVGTHISRGRFIILGSSGELLPVSRCAPIILDRSKYSSCQSDELSTPEEYHSACSSISDISDSEDEEQNARRYSGQLDTAEHRKMFAERLREALCRAQSSSTSDSSYAVGISVSGSSIADPNIRMRRGGSRGFMLEENSFEESYVHKQQKESHEEKEIKWLGNDCCKIQNISDETEKNKGGSSKYSFSTDNSDAEDIYEQLNHWMEERACNGDEISSFSQQKIRENAIIQFAGGLLKRTLSESFLGVPLTEGGEGEVDEEFNESDVPIEQRNSLKIKMAARSLSLELAKHKHKLAAQLISVIGQKHIFTEGGMLPVVTGNWGCGSRHLGDPQLKLIIQWIAASVAGIPFIVYYTSSNYKLLKLDTVCRVLLDRQWNVGDLIRATMHFTNTMLSNISRNTSAVNESDAIFDYLINTDENIHRNIIRRK